MSNFKLVSFHENKHFEDRLVELLNSEWPRSKAARVHSLEKSCDQMPISLLLVDENCSLIGHAGLRKLIRSPTECWIESVIVDANLRGRGFGKLLMNYCERFAEENYGVTTMYLSTHDKAAFYERLGYRECPPIVVSFASNGLADNGRLKKFIALQYSKTDYVLERNCDKNNIKNPSTIGANSQSTPPPPPAPPPPTFPPNRNNNESPKQVYMRKKLS